METKIILFTVIGVLVLYSTVGSIDVSFESSKGDWADSEILLKGRDFNQIVQMFSEYQNKCAAKDAIMFRTTPINWYNVVAWWSFTHDTKWKVPFKETTTPPGHYVRPPCDK
ncbi:MAG: hypothetical protein PHR30_03450 [Gallionellaceae bacterium]|nr:hypothetical protein [Gallionellaceae bacterium]